MLAAVQLPCLDLVSGKAEGCHLGVFDDIITSDFSNNNGYFRGVYQWENQRSALARAVLALAAAICCLSWPGRLTQNRLSRRIQLAENRAKKLELGPTWWGILKR
jgi:hypothetical protein